MRIYIDTCVYRDYLEERKSEFGRDLFEPAYKLFKSIRENKHEVIISTHLIQELGNIFTSERCRDLLQKLKIKSAKYFDGDVKQAKKLGLKYLGSEDEYKDALHMIIAKRENAIYVVTTNFIHFDLLNEEFKLDVKRPKEILPYLRY